MSLFCAPSRLRSVSPLLSKRSLYVITCAEQVPFDQFHVLRKKLARLSLLQYRDKGKDQRRRTREIRVLQRCCLRNRTRLIINDDWRLCRRTRADGVHLGRGDAPLQWVRRQLNRKALLGSSCHNSIPRALAEAKKGASHVAFGAIFPSLTKPHASRVSQRVLRRARSLIRRRVSVVAIGGIHSQRRVIGVRRWGADLAATIEGFWSDQR